jgi:hypothetical protein
MLGPLSSTFSRGATWPTVEATPPPSAESQNQELRGMIERLQTQVTALKQTTKAKKARVRRHRRAS